MRVASTIRFESVEIIGESDLGLCCRITGRDHWIASDRLLDGSSIAHFGDRGVLVIARQFAEECGLIAVATREFPTRFTPRTVEPRLPAPSSRVTST